MIWKKTLQINFWLYYGWRLEFTHLGFEKLFFRLEFNPPFVPPFPRGTSVDETLQNCLLHNFGERPPLQRRWPKYEDGGFYYWLFYWFVVVNPPESPFSIRDKRWCGFTEFLKSCFGERPPLQRRWPKFEDGGFYYWLFYWFVVINPPFVPPFPRGTSADAALLSFWKVASESVLLCKGGGRSLRTEDWNRFTRKSDKRTGQK